MDPVNIASIVITLITVIGGGLAQRAANRAAKKSPEGEAYERARKFDTDTIDRQDAELKELREKVKSLETQNEAQHQEMQQLKSENTDLRARLSRLEREVPAISDKGNTNG